LRWFFFFENKRNPAYFSRPDQPLCFTAFARFRLAVLYQPAFCHHCHTFRIEDSGAQQRLLLGDLRNKHEKTSEFYNQSPLGYFTCKPASPTVDGTSIWNA
jgi:hypothetical protein